MNGFGLLAPVIARLENMTAEEAAQAQRESGDTSPAGPVFQWQAWHEDLPRLRSRFEKGDAQGLLRAIELCAIHSLPLPDWCQVAYLGAWRKAKGAECRTLDEAFGYDMKGVNLDRAQERYQLSLVVAIEVARHYGSGARIENAFQKVAGEYPVSPSRAREWFYALRHHPAVAAYLPAESEIPWKDGD